MRFLKVFLCITHLHMFSFSLFFLFLFFQFFHFDLEIKPLSFHLISFHRTQIIGKTHIKNSKLRLMLWFLYSLFIAGTYSLSGRLSPSYRILFSCYFISFSSFFSISLSLKPHRNIFVHSPSPSQPTLTHTSPISPLPSTLPPFHPSPPPPPSLP